MPKPAIKRTYYSLAEFAEDSNRRHTGRVTTSRGNDWTGGATFNDAVKLARVGWNDQLESALDIAESAVDLAVREHMMDTFSPVWDVTGSMVDIGAYLEGVPECMIDSPVTKVSKQGRVITLVASCMLSSSISASAIIKRGRLIVALALALSRLGHNVELWLDCHGLNGAGERDERDIEIQVCIKSADDELDPAAIMFAYAHPAVLRQLMFGNYEADTRHFTAPCNPRKGSYPEGSIILPSIYSDNDVPNADQFLRQYLGELGLLAE